jgi:hypothetical protein
MSNEILENREKVETMYNKIGEIIEGEKASFVTCAIIGILTDMVVHADNEGACPANKYIETISNQLESAVNKRKGVH